MVNNNFSRDKNSHNQMLEEWKVAAYYDPWKYFIEKISNGDIVFLYQSGHGIVAYGYADGIVNHVNTYPEVEKDAGYNMKLLNFVRLKMPMPTSAIAPIFIKTINKKTIYRLTMVSIDKDVAKNLVAEINKNYI